MYVEKWLSEKGKFLLKTGEIQVATLKGSSPRVQSWKNSKKKARQAFSRNRKQLIIESFYWGIVRARKEVRFQILLKTLIVQNRPHYRDIISIQILTELLRSLLGKIRFLDSRTSSLGCLALCVPFSVHDTPTLHWSTQISSKQQSSTKLTWYRFVIFQLFL